jgi:hypothetical protein
MIALESADYPENQVSPSVARQGSSSHHDRIGLSDTQLGCINGKLQIVAEISCRCVYVIDLLESLKNRANACKAVVLRVPRGLASTCRENRCNAK